MPDQKQRSRVVRESLQPCSDEFHRQQRTGDEWQALVTNVREWPGQDMLLGECRCGSTLSWNVLPTRFDDDGNGPEQRAKKRKNPYKSTDPKNTSWRDTYFVPLANLSDEEIESLPRSAFNDEEWEELPHTQQEKIWEHPESQERVDAFVEYLIDQADAHRNLPEQYIVDFCKEEFHSYLQERADELVDDANDEEVREIVDFYDGYPAGQVKRAISRALGDRKNYDYEVGSSGEPAFYTATYHDEEFSVDPDDLIKKIRSIGMFQDEFHMACLRLGKKDSVEDAYRNILRLEWPWPSFSGPADEAPLYDKTNKDPKNVPPQRVIGHLYGNVSVDADVRWDPDWRMIKRDVDNILEQEGALWEDFEEDDNRPEGDTRPEAERIVHRFPDGFYVLELTPTDMKAEGEEQGHCIGDPGQGFTGAVRNGRGKAWSIRTASGRPKISIFAAIYPSPDGVLNIIEQVKGKANRLVGWDLRKVGPPHKVKEHEVVMATAFIESLGTDPFVVGDLLPALAAMREANPRWYQALSAKWRPLPGLGSPRENPARKASGVCPACGGAPGGFCSGVTA